MFLKNISKDITVVISTVVGKIGVDPGEVVNIKHKILPPISANLKQVSEQEFYAFQKGSPELDEIETDTTNITDDNIDNQNTNKFMDEILKLSAVNAVLNPGVSEGIDETNTTSDTNNSDETQEDKSNDSIVEQIADTLTVKPITSNSQKDLIQQQIDDLKATWLVADSATKKAKIQKDIKKLEKQLSKIK